MRRWSSSSFVSFLVVAPFQSVSVFVPALLPAEKILAVLSLVICTSQGVFELVPLALYAVSGERCEVMWVWVCYSDCSVCCAWLGYVRNRVSLSRALSMEMKGKRCDILMVSDRKREMERLVRN
jgi:hypothetical protein